MNNPQDSNEAYGYQEPGQEYGQDQYEETYPEEGAEEGHDPSQLPVRDNRSFMQKFGNVVIFGGVGIFVLVMGYINFGSVLFPKKSDIPNVSSLAESTALTTQPAATPEASAALTPNTSNPAAPAGSTAVTPDAANPSPAANAAMGVSPAAPVTGATNSAPSAPVPTTIPAAPVATASNDPWAQPAPAPQPQQPQVVSPNGSAAMAVTTPAQPANSVPAPSATAQVPAPSSDGQKLADLEKKLNDLQTADQEKDSTIADLQNRLAAAQAASANTAATAPSPDQTAATPAAKPVRQAKHKHTAGTTVASAHSAKPSWELRAVSDGVAWLGRPGDVALTSVQVGDKLAGIGRVTAIRQQGDAWIVVGTQGKIGQN